MCLIAIVSLGFFFLKDNLFGMSTISLDTNCLSDETNNASQILVDLNISNFLIVESNCSEKMEFYNLSNSTVKDGRTIYINGTDFLWCNKDGNLLLKGNQERLNSYWGRYIHCNILCYELNGWDCNATWKPDCSGNTTYSSATTCQQALNAKKGCSVDANCTKEADKPNDCSLFFKGGKIMQNGVCGKMGCEYAPLTSNCSNGQIFLQKYKWFIGLFILIIIVGLTWFYIINNKRR